MATFEFDVTKDFAAAMNARDPLAAYRERFHIPPTLAGGDCIYLSGHSLGLQPKSTRAYIEQELEDWEAFGVEGHFRASNPWLPYHETLAESTARLVGALPGEVVVMNSLTVNLHLMLVTFYRPTAERNKILIEPNAFPSDQYAVKSQLHYHGYDPGVSLIHEGFGHLMAAASHIGAQAWAVQQAQRLAEGPCDLSRSHMQRVLAETLAHWLEAPAGNCARQ